MGQYYQIVINRNLSYNNFTGKKIKDTIIHKTFFFIIFKSTELLS